MAADSYSPGCLFPFRPPSFKAFGDSRVTEYGDAQIYKTTKKVSVKKMGGA